MAAVDVQSCGPDIFRLKRKRTTPEFIPCKRQLVNFKLLKISDLKTELCNYIPTPIPSTKHTSTSVSTLQSLNDMILKMDAKITAMSIELSDVKKLLSLNKNDCPSYIN